MSKYYNEFKNPKTSYIHDKKLVVSSICVKFSSWDEKKFAQL